MSDDGSYVSEFGAFRSRDSYAIEALDPFAMAITWQAPAEWL